MRVATLALLVVSAAAAVIVAASAASADNHGGDGIYGCFLYNGEVFWDGYAHPAVFGSGPSIGASPSLGLAMLAGPECDEFPSRADYADKRVWSPEYQPATPTPLPTPGAVPGLRRAAGWRVLMSGV
ncbi:MAG: hypothetical protein F4X72_00040, partial [Dehalococcoidia bacterium]|nr:hypothetical protein [Dehalococcoidia bacterium]